MRGMLTPLFILIAIRGSIAQHFDYALKGIIDLSAEEMYGRSLLILHKHIKQG